MTAFRERIFDTESWIGTSRAMAGRRLPPWPADLPSPAGPGAAPGPTEASEHSAKLARVVETEVIPRLLQAHRSTWPCGAGAPAQEWAGAGATDGVREFAGLVMAPDAAGALSYVALRRARGMTPEALYLDLLAPAARYLGEMWEEDSASFLEVTLGLLRLQRVMSEIGPAFRGERPDMAEAGERVRRALLLPAPGDQHTFGAAMVADFFRRAGWTIWTAPRAPVRALAGVVRREWFTLVGFSVSCADRLDAVEAVIRAIRRASRNPDIAVLVGGPVFVAHPEFAALVGADGTARDGRQAVLQAESLLALQPQRTR